MEYPIYCLYFFCTVVFLCVTPKYEEKKIPLELFAFKDEENK